MRQHRLGAAMPKGSWCPLHANKEKKERAVAAVEVPANGPVMSRLPSWRGEHRIISLYHYFHADMGYILEADPEVLTWTTDVEAVPYEEDGQQKVFVPSIKAYTRTGVRLIKLIHGSKPGRGGAKPLTAKTAPRPQPGVTFEIYSRRDLEAHPRLRASRDIVYHRCRELDAHLPMRLAATFAGRPPRKLGEVHAFLGGTPEDWFDVLALVAKGHVEVDMDMPLGPDMPVIECRAKGYRDA